MQMRYLTTMKPALLFATALLGGPAHAVAISYDISVSSPSDSSGWYGGLSWGIPGLPILGTITVNDQSKLLESFSLTAGPTSWSQANIGSTPSLSFDSGGNLVSFNLSRSYSLPSGIYQMQLRSDNFFELFDGNNVAGCYGCVHFSAQAQPPVPEPGAVFFVSIGLAGLLFGRRKRRAVPDRACGS
jgi:hypothetical protein